MSVGGGAAVSAGWSTAAAFAGGGGTAIFTATLLSEGIAVLASEGAAMLGGGTDVVADAPVTGDAAPIRQSADEVGTVATAGPESDGGGTSYFLLAAYCAYWCLK